MYDETCITSFIKDIDIADIRNVLNAHENAYIRFAINCVVLFHNSWYCLCVDA
jgi:hypothetical protein